MKRRGPLPLLLLLAGALPAALAGQTPGQQGGPRADKPPVGWTPERMMDVGMPAVVALSPDGKRVAYTVRSAVIGPGQSEYVNRLHVANADGSASAPAAVRQPPGSAHDPQWSPDGKSLAFLGPHLGRNNLWLLPKAGPARLLTRMPTAVTAFAWSPDGKQLAFAMPDPPTPEEEQARQDRDDAFWLDENPKQVHLHLVAVAAGDDLPEPRRLTRGSFSVVPGFQWSPDGKAIVFGHTRTPRADDWRTADVSAVDVASGQLTPLAATPAAESSPRFSPDGKWVALLASGTPPRGLEEAGIRIVSADGKTTRPRVTTPDRRPNLLGWDRAGERLFFSEFRGTATRIYALNVRTGVVAALNRSNEVMDSVHLNRGGTHLAFALQGSHKAPEVFVTPVDRFAPVQVSRINAHLPALPLGKVEVTRWKGKDGLEIEGLLTYPVGHRPGQRCPLLLVIHGGPAGVFSQRYLASPSVYPLAAFAARGFAVLQPNPRGSTGYGLKFRTANFKDWGGADHQDLMAGVDHVIGRGVADPKRLGVMGWSFGGYMTAWAITQTRRFKAASVGAGVTNLVSQAGTTDVPSQRLAYFGAFPWDDPQFYQARSPVLHAKGVTTPTLIQHGEQDRRVPIGQGHELYNALKQQGAPVRMLVLPRQGHGPTEPRMLLRVMRTNLEWFEKHLRPGAD
jgi:dipeptidyl aminopeptidase/acylaminoacyl peptidase